MPKFVHLHTHSHYSLLDGLGQIDELVKLTKKYDMPAMALTDHGVMYGAIEFYKKAKKAGIKPIIGVEAYVARNGHLNKRAKLDERPYHLILLAKDITGYKNLVKLTTIAHLQGFYYKPRIDFELLQQYHEGIICATACTAGELANHILNNDLPAARDMISRYQDLFGKENFYLEVQSHPHFDKQNVVNEAVFKLSAETGAPVIATNDIHYPNSDDEYAQDVLLCIQTKKTLAESDRMSYVGFDLSFKSAEAMAEAFADHPEVLENTIKVADACNLELELGKNILPNFPLPEGFTADEYLKEICEKGLIEHFGAGNITPVLRERLDYELSVIAKTGYAGYFLIVSDFIIWAKEHGIVVGPGRGSAAGSLVAFVTSITNIDPIKYDLVFERFLNPERISMPDIDTDFADSHRDDVLDYVADKYGRDHVAQIITFGTMAARNAIRDVGRAMGLPYNYCDRVAKLVPMGMDLTEACDSVPEFKDILNDADGAKLIATAKRLEGVCRHASTHACGVVITPESLDNYAPRQFGSNETIVVQYDGHGVEDLGLLKMDFLGLSNLTIIEQTLKIVKKIHNIEIDINHIPLDDQKSFKIFQDGRTTGVFQFESAGMKRYLKQLLPTELEDIIAMVALYRPGPMEYIPDYINGKHGRKKPQYLHPKLEPILKNTYGVAVYQEQLLRIARDLAGFTYGQADVLRKAVGKKIKELLDEQEHKMVAGMVENGIDKKVAVKIWEFILPFAAYGFNRSHAACYALIGYQTAWLKANYPAEFMAALLTADQQNLDRIAIEVDECRQMGIEVLAPDINESFADFGVVANSLTTGKPRIRFGLLAVKGLGENIVAEIIKERKANGIYNNLEDLLTRVKSKDLNKRSLEAMAKAGVMDTLLERNAILHNMDRLLSFVNEFNKGANSSQDSLFSATSSINIAKLKLDKIAPLDKKQKLTWEKELLGLYISEHPMADISQVVRNYAVSCSTLKNCADGSEVRVAGVIFTIKKINTKKGDAMLFVKIEDTAGDVEILVFPKVLAANPHMWQPDTIVIVSGTVSDKDGERKVLCDSAVILNTANLKETLDNFLVQSRDNKSKTRRFNFGDKSFGGGERIAGEVKVKEAPAILDKIINLKLSHPLDFDISRQLKELILKHQGNHLLELIVTRGEAKEKIRTTFRINYCDEFRQAAEKLLGEGIMEEIKA
jgi:DNA polymerase-3 subunit alpha